MLTPDQDLRLSGEVIPFQPRKTTETSMVTTTIAALVAVTILHDSSHSPEDKLVELIEQSGEAEVLESADAYDMFPSDDTEPAMNLTPAATNYNFCIGTVTLFTRRAYTPSRIVPSAPFYFYVRDLWVIFFP